ncbi:MAG: protein translocase subunit SecD [Candidatus Scalinduaceae bacterium]
MPRNLRWKIPLIAILIAVTIYAIYPPADKVIKMEEIKEIDGEVVERTVTKDSFFRFIYSKLKVRENIIKKETDEKGSNIIHKNVEYFARGQIKLGLDLRGGSELLYKIKVEEGEYHTGLTNEIIAVLEKRIDPRGVLEYRLQQQGARRVLIQVPGATKSETENLKERITRLGKLEFRLAASPDSSEYKDAKEGQTVPGYYKHWLKKKRGEVGETEDWFLVRNKIEMTGEHLSRLYPDRKDIQPVVGFEFDQVGRAKFGRLTERNIGKPLAIILDGVLYSAPVIRDRIRGKGIIEGNFTSEEVNDLIAVMRAGSLPADLELEMETTVGPSLGRDSIKKGLTAGLIGGVFVILFMCTYYLGAGIVSNIAFIVNIIMVVGILCILEATLTLPGIAGLVLMIGMAVDANVLIYERIREEKEKGKPIKLAVKNGYERAFTTIVDSNVTTLITATILYAVGTGPVKGFAIVLIVGLLINMFTAVFFTRVIFEILLGIGFVRKISMLQFFRKPRLSFITYRRFFAIASLILILIGISVFVVRGKDNYDIDFTGGTLIHMKLNNPIPVGDVRNKFSNLGYEDAEVQSIWASKDIAKTKIDSTEFGIRIKSLNNEKTKQKITNDLMGVIDEGLFKRIDFNKPYDFSLILGRPIDEFKIQNYLREADYRRDNIVSIYPVGKTAKKYSINVSGFTNKKFRLDTIKNLTSILTDYLETSTVEPLFGDIKEELPTITDAARGAQYRAISIMDIDFKKVVDPTVLQMVLNEEGYADIEVFAKESVRGKTFRKKLQISGARDVLEQIKQMREPMNIPSIFVEGNSMIRVELKEDIVEGALRKMLSSSSKLRKLVGEIAGIGVTAEKYSISMNDLTAEKVQEKIREDIGNTFELDLYIDKANASSPDPFKRVVSIGSTVASEMKSRAALALLFACFAIIIYIWFRFGEFKFGATAVITLIHDVLITVGAVAIADHFGNVFGDIKINLPMIAAFLTLIGYSLNDTIVLFDRIRENLAGKQKTLTKELIDNSINQNLNRTIITSLTTFGVVSTLYFVGGPAIHGFAFVMMVGVVVGTYSSIFIASPLLLDWDILKKISKILFLCITSPLWLPIKLLRMSSKERKLKPSRA